jgi:cysteine-rich repeat protein
MARAAAPRALVLAALALGVAPACSAISGLDGLEFVRDDATSTTTTTTAAAGGAGGVAPTGGAGGQAGSGGASSSSGGAGGATGGGGATGSGGATGGGGTTGGGGATGSGGTTGSGGGAPCENPAVDCPAPATDCEVAQCSPGGHCTVAFVAAGVPTGAQTPGDCLEIRCNGKGGTQSVPADDPADDGKECTVDACSGGQAVHAPRPLRTPCSQGGGAMCDLAGACVGCVDWTDCQGGACKAGACQAPACGDGVPTQGEACDDGDTTGGDGCSAGCTVEKGFTCSGQPSTCTPKCGDGLLVGGETCEDGNTDGGDCCSGSCQIEAGCEVEPNDAKATANDFDALAVGGSIKGRIAPDSEDDYFSVTVPVGASQLTAEVLDGAKSTCVSNKLDSYLTLYGPNGSLVTVDDDSGAGYCSLLAKKALAPGKYTIRVERSLIQGTFDYTLHVTIQ